MPQRWLLYAAILLASVVPHLKGISAPVLDYHYHRQANTAAIAKNFHEDGLPLLRPRIDWRGADSGRAATEMPVYMWLVGLFWPLFGLREIWGRLLSTFFSALTAVVLFRFLEKSGPSLGWLPTRAAFWASIFFGLMPVEIFFGRTVQPEAFALLCVVSCLWAFDRWLAGYGPLLWAVAAAAAILAIGHKLPYAYLLGVVAALAWARRGPACLRQAGFWSFLIVVPLLVFAWYKYASLGVYVVPTKGSAYWNLLNYERLPYFFFYQLFSRQVELSWTYPGALFFAAGAWTLVAAGPWFLGAWWACVLAGLLACGGYAFHHEYTALSWVPVNAAIIGLGFDRLLERYKDTRRWLLFLLVAAMPVNAAFRIGHWYRINFPYLLALKPVTDRISAPGDLFFCNERASSVPLFYLGRRGWAWDLEELGEGSLYKVEELIPRGAKFLFTEKKGPFLDRKSPIASFFYRRYPVVHEDAQTLIFRLSPKSLTK